MEITFLKIIFVDDDSGKNVKIEPRKISWLVINVVVGGGFAAAQEPPT